MKYQDAYNKIKTWLIEGKLGESGMRLLSAQELSNRCGISFVNTLKIIRQLKDELYLAAINQKLYVAGGLAKRRSDLRKQVSGSRKIGVLIPSVTNPFFAELTERFYEHLTKEGYIPLLYLSRPSANSELDGLKYFLQNECKGVIILSSPKFGEHVETFNRFPLPYVVVGKVIPGLNVSSVTSENRSTGAFAAKHLMLNGYTHFAYMQQQDTHENDERLDGFKAGIQAANQPVEGIQIIELDSVNQTWKFKLSAYIDGLKAEEKLGIFCYHDLIAFEAYAYLSNAGYEVPQKVGIIGYDNLPISQTYNLTTCSYSYNEIVKQTVSCLLEQIELSTVQKKSLKIQTILIARNSTKAPNVNF